MLYLNNMKVLIDSFIIIFPLLALVVLGFCIKRINLLSDSTIKELNRIIISLLIPVNVFMSIYNSDFKTDFNLKFVLYCIICVILSFILSLAIFNSVKTNSVKVSLIQASVRPNIAIIGIPLAVSIYGQSVSGITAIGVAFCAPLYNVLSLILFETLNDNKYDVKEILNKLFKNPILISTIIAFILKSINIHIPSMFYDTLSYMSRATTAISLIVLGASFKFSFTDHKKQLIMALIIKMIIIPALVLTIGVLIGFRNETLVALLALFASPVAISAYSFASGYDADLDLTSSIIIYSYLICIISLPIFISIVRILNFI